MVIFPKSVVVVVVVVAVVEVVVVLVVGYTEILRSGKKV